MKHSHHHDHGRSVQPPVELVRFQFTHPTATTVCVAGTFNDWQADARPMQPLGEGRWLTEMVLPAGTYEYRLVVDGQWIADPLARESVPNPFGGRNSVLQVTSSTEAPSPADAELAPPENPPTVG